MSSRALFLFAIMLGLSGTALADTTKLSTFEQFEKEKATILQDIKGGMIYSEIKHSDAKMVRDALDRMSTTLAGVHNAAQLDQERLVTLYNEQTLVNTILTMAENDSRTVCRRRSRLGTNFKTTTCETVAERRVRQEADRLAISNILKSDIKPVIGPGPR